MDPALLARGQHHLPLVGGGLARHHALHHRREVVEGLGPQHLGGGVADDVAEAEPAQVGEGAVHEDVAPLGVQVGDRDGDVVHEQAQLRLLLGELVLRDLQVVDVAADDVVALEDALRVHVRLQAHQVPAHVAVGRADEPLVGEALAAPQALDVRVEELAGGLLAQQLGHGAAQDPVRALAAHALEGAVHVLVAEVRADEGDGLGDVLRVEAQLPLLALERLAQALVVVDVQDDRVDPAHRAVGGEVGDEVHADPALGAVGRARQALVDRLLPGHRGVHVRAHLRQDLGRVELALVLADRARDGDAGDPVQAGRVHEAEDVAGVDVGHGQAHVLGDELELPRSGLERLLQAVVLLDVHHHDEHAAHLARGVLVRDHVAADVPLLAAGPDGLALVGDRLARPGPLQERLGLREHLGRGERDIGVPHHRLARLPRPVEAGLVREAHDALAVDVGHREADAVGDERQLALALGEGVLRVLQVLDVHERDAGRRDGAFQPEGEVVRAHRVALERALDRLPVVGERLAPEDAGERLAPVIARLEAEGVGGRPAQELPGRLARVGEVGRVRIAVETVAVQHAGREREQVEAGAKPRESGLQGIDGGGGLGIVHPCSSSCLAQSTGEAALSQGFPVDSCRVDHIGAAGRRTATRAPRTVANTVPAFHL